MKKVWTKASFSNEITEREVAHRKLSREAAAESIVLLKNDGTLPIQAGRIALFGAGAAATIKGGTGSGEVNERHSVTIWEGLKNAGFTITTEAWLRDYVELLKSEKERFYKAFFKKMQKAMFGSDDLRINIMSNGFHYPVGRLITDDEISATNTDNCIYVIARQAGECSDRKFENHEYTLEPDEIANIKLCAVKYKKFILAINIGSSIDMSPLDEIDGINAIIYFCQQGMEGGNAFTDIITGKVSPSGCLTNTWARKYDDLPFAQEYSYLKGEIGKEFYKEGIYVGYRYFDSFNVEPRYEFGYGLTYSDYAIDRTDAKVNESIVTVSAKVTNTGKQYSGKKIVQLYVNCPSGRLVRERQSLSSFAKTRTLAPGESEEVSLVFDLTDLAGYDESVSAYILEAGDYVLHLGFSSRQTEPVAIISLDHTVITEQCAKVCPLSDKLDELFVNFESQREVRGNLVHLTVNSKDIRTVIHDYSKTLAIDSPKVKSWLNKLTLNDKMAFLLGTGVSPNMAGLIVPGAAASTTTDYLDKGICNVSLSDGPAGIRLQRTSVITKKGAVKAVEPMMEMLRFAGTLVKMMLFAKPNKGKQVYQYATAFPVGTAMAQTWDVSLLEKFGDAIGVEMEEFGVTFWLAPGMNIQRNPLCGRNYEYYSEDPILTGRMAAAAIKGVQSHDGCYATIKHFAANNQEQLRNHSDSIVSERALREIYLKGFKIAIREGGAKSVMTSYNLLNGEYTASSYDLCTKLLRQEWGFNGVVMSDWFATGKGMANNGLAIKSGNDLIMPGGKEFMKRLKKDLKNGLVSEEDITCSCARILEAVANSRTQREFEERKKEASQNRA
jgi:beta-glucosidase